MNKTLISECFESLSIRTGLHTGSVTIFLDEMFDFHRQMALDTDVNPWSKSSYVAPEMSSAGLAQSTGSPGDCAKLTAQLRKVFDRLTL